MDSDILHNGGLENLKNYKIFKRRFAKKENLPVRTITDWYISEIPSIARNCCTWICLIGVYKDTLIRTSEVTGIISSRKICTANCIYILGEPSKVLDFPLKGIERYFVNGFPANWEQLVRETASRKEQSNIFSSSVVPGEADMLKLADSDNLPVHCDLNKVNSELGNKVLRSSLKSESFSNKFRSDCLSEVNSNKELKAPGHSEKSSSVVYESKRKNSARKTSLPPKALGIPLDEDRQDEPVSRPSVSSNKRKSHKKSVDSNLIVDSLATGENDSLTNQQSICINNESFSVKTDVEINNLEREFHTPLLDAEKAICPLEDHVKSDLETYSNAFNADSSILSESIIQLNMEVLKDVHIPGKNCVPGEQLSQSLESNDLKKRKLSIESRNHETIDTLHTINEQDHLNQDMAAVVNQTLDIPSIIMPDQINCSDNEKQNTISSDSRSIEQSEQILPDVDHNIVPLADAHQSLISDTASELVQLEFEQELINNQCIQPKMSSVSRNDLNCHNDSQFINSAVDQNVNLSNEPARQGFFEKFDQIDSGIFLEVKKDVFGDSVSGKCRDTNQIDSHSELETSSNQKVDNQGLNDNTMYVSNEKCQKQTSIKNIDEKQSQSLASSTHSDNHNQNDINLCSELAAAVDPVYSLSDGNLDIKYEIDDPQRTENRNEEPKCISIEESNLNNCSHIDNTSDSKTIFSKSDITDSVIVTNDSTNQEVILNHTNEAEITNFKSDNGSLQGADSCKSQNSFPCDLIDETNNVKPTKRKSYSTIKIFKKRPAKQKVEKRLSEPTIRLNNDNYSKNNSLPSIFEDLLSDSQVKRESLSRQQVSKVLIRRSLSNTSKTAADSNSCSFNEECVATEGIVDTNNLSSWPSRNIESEIQKDDAPSLDDSTNNRLCMLETTIEKCSVESNSTATSPVNSAYETQSNLDPIPSQPKAPSSLNISDDHSIKPDINQSVLKNNASSRSDLLERTYQIDVDDQPLNSYNLEESIASKPDTLPDVGQSITEVLEPNSNLSINLNVDCYNESVQKDQGVVEVVTNKTDVFSKMPEITNDNSENLSNLPLKIVDSLDPYEVSNSQKTTKTKKRKTLIIMPKRLKGKKSIKK